MSICGVMICIVASVALLAISIVGIAFIIDKIGL